MLKKIFYSTFVRILIGIIAMAGAVSLTQVGAHELLYRSGLETDTINIVVGLAVAAVAFITYIFLFKFYDKREISELSLHSFGQNAAIGFVIGLGLQSLVILTLWFYDGYEVVRVNPISFLLPAFAIGVTSAIVEELIIRGVLFRILEERLGSVIALAISAAIFGLLHFPNKGATVFSTVSIAIQAGILLAAAFIWSRSLWLPIFLHFAWNFAEAGIYGAIISGNVVEKSLITSRITGPEWLTGGFFGPENSVQAALFCMTAAVAFLLAAKKKGNFIQPYWARNKNSK